MAPSSRGDCQTWPKPAATLAGVSTVSTELKPVWAASPWNWVLLGAPGCCPSVKDGVRRSSNCSRCRRERVVFWGRRARRDMVLSPKQEYGHQDNGREGSFADDVRGA